MRVTPRRRRRRRRQHEGVQRANVRALAAEKRFEVLVDWSRKEESKRLRAEDAAANCLEKLENNEREYNSQVAGLGEDITELSAALEEVNNACQKKHKDLLSREEQLLEMTKKLAVSEELSRSSTSESAALKSLCAKLEVELEGHRSRLKNVEMERAEEVRLGAAEAKALAREGRKLAEAVEEAENGRRRAEEGAKEERDKHDRRETELKAERDEAVRASRSLEARLQGFTQAEKATEGRTNLLVSENEELKRRLWAAESAAREREERALKAERRAQECERKNEDLNRMLDGLEDDVKGNAKASGSPSLLRYNIKPLY